MESEKGTELPDSVEGEFEAGAKVEDSSSSLQTLYTNLTPVTIQDENGLRQIYVPVEQADTLTSLAESISDTTGNQQLSVSGIPGQLITITLPHGTAGAVNQLQITDGTLLSLQENGDVPFSVTENDQINARQESATKDEHTIPMVVSDSEISQIHKEASSQGEIGSELLGTLLNAHDSSCNINKNKEDEFSSKKSDDFTAYIRTLLTQPHDGITDNSSQDETDEPVPPPERRSSVQLRPKTLPQVFSSIEANLSGALLNAIPVSKSAFLCNIEEECGVELKANSDDTFSFLCSESQIMNLYEKLSVLLPSAKNPFRHKEQRHKGVSCDLLRPMFSRSGREVKPKHYEIPVDDEPAQHDSDEEVKVLTGVKRKRGRPPKQVKTIGESSKKPSGYRKQIPRLATRKETDEAQTKDNVCISSHEENLANCTKAREMSSSVTVSTENLKGQTTKKHVETPTNIELDAGSSCDGLQVEEFVESNKGLNNVADGTLNLNEDSLKVLIKLNVEKTVPSTKNGLSDDKMMKVANLKPVKKSKSLVIKKRPKKDYESLLPFKYFCNQCSFKSKRQSHYSKHLQLHERGLPLLRCNQCNFTTIRLSHLRRHTLFHTSELHQCRNCKYRTYDMQHLNRHMKVKHPSVRNTVVKVFECPMCEYVTSTEFQYKRHLRVHADVSGGVENPDRIVASYQCPVCDYNTKKKDHFARHMKQVHTEHRPYLCDLCGKSFKRQDTLRSHKVVHMDKSVRLYPFRCNTCSKDFRTQAHLTEHLSTHSNARQYLCEICGASFKTRNVQRKHVKTIHRNPRSHKCPDCDKSFNTKFALQRHARTHDTPGMRKVKQVSLVGEPETITIIPGVNDLTSVDHVTSATVQDIGADEEHHVPPTVTSELQPSHVTVPLTTECGTLTETQQIAIPLPVEMQQQAHEVPATIQLGDTTHAVTLAEGTYEQDADGSLRQIIPHFIQTGDATTTLLYVPNL